MSTLIVAVVAFFGYFVAYHTYGRWLARKIFQLDATAVVPSIECRDDIDYCPTNRQVVFGHHLHQHCGHRPDCRAGDRRFLGLVAGLAVGVVRLHFHRSRA
jgi:carbon starvation protein